MISTEKEFNVFEGLTEGFEFGKLQDIITLKKHLDKHNYTLDDVESYIQWKKDILIKEQEKQIKEYEKNIKPAQEALQKKVPECPKCGEIVYIHSIKTEKGRGNERGYKSLWQCSGDKCVYEIYNLESALDIVKGLVGEKHAKNLGLRE